MHLSMHVIMYTYLCMHTVSTHEEMTDALSINNTTIFLPMTSLIGLFKAVIGVSIY